jgi:hypothetical protein
MLVWCYLVPFLVSCMLNFNMSKDLFTHTSRTPCLSPVHNAAAMLVWGWRVPFLMSIVTLAVAAILRYNMPESSEFTMSREELSEEAIKRARQAQAHGIEAGSSAAGSTDGHISVIDVEGQSAAAVSDDKKAHYVPVLELFRGYWSGLVLHSLYGACESSKHGLIAHRLCLVSIDLYTSWHLLMHNRLQINSCMTQVLLSSLW